MIKKYFALSIIAASVAVVGCSSDDDPVVVPEVPEVPDVVLPDVTPDEGGTAYDTIAASTVHTTLKAAIDSVTDLDKTLDNPESVFTIFAPTDAAFDAFVAADTEDEFNSVPDLLLAENQAVLVNILNYHVLSPAVANTPVTSTDIANNLNDGDDTNNVLATLVADASLSIAATTTDPAAASGADVVDSAGNVVALNDVDQGIADPITGIVHSIDAVLIPPAAPEVTEPPAENPPATGEDGPVLTAMKGDADGFTKVLATLDSNQIKLDENDATEDPWTIFAPTDAALAAGEVTLGDMVFVGTPRQTPEELLARADGTISTFNGSKTYAIGGTDEASLTIGGAPAIVLGGGTSIAYKLTAVPVANP